MADQVSAPRPEGMSETPVDQRLEQSEVERRANLPMPMNFYLCGWDATAILYAREIVRLRADGATLRERVRRQLIACLPLNEHNGYCFCDGPDTRGVHFDWCPASILQRFDEPASAPKEPTP